MLERKICIHSSEYQVSIFGVWRERERHIVLNVSGIYIGYVIHNSCMHQRREGWHKNYNKFSVFN